MSIPASNIVAVYPSVLSAGGNGLALNGLILSPNPLIPVGPPISFPSAQSVAELFGNYDAAFTGSVSGSTLTVSTLTSGTLAIGQEVQGTSIPVGTYIASLGTGSGGTGTYFLNTTPGTIASGTFTSAPTETRMAEVYFGGFEGSNTKPGALLFSRYAVAAAGAFLMGGAVNLTLADVQAITSGSLSITIDGSAKTAASIDLHTATSLTDAGKLIATALSLAGTSTVTWNALTSSFMVTSGTTGASSTITVATGTLAATLGLTTATGAYLSQGCVAMTPAVAMADIIASTQNWASFGPAWEPTLADKEAFATWNSSQDSRYLFAVSDSDITASQTPTSFTGFGAWVKANSIVGTVAVWNSIKLVAFVLGVGASIDFTEVGGRTTYKFKSSSLLTPNVTDLTTATNLNTNGYSFYGSYATAAQGFIFFSDGQISGPALWADSYVNAIWLNNAIQLAEMQLLTNRKAVPYDALGYNLITAAATDPITQGVQFGAITPGIPLSASQVAQVNAAAGVAIDSVLSTRGWYFQVLPATAQVRANRQSPPCTLWYMDGGSVQKLTINSVAVQ